jgi:pre-rRNA-processing protein IPI3
MTHVYAGAGSSLHLVNALDGTIESSASPCHGRGLACVSGDWVLAAQRKEAAIFVFRRGQKSPHVKCRLSEPVGPICASPDGSYCFAGGLSGTMYAWELWSGQLVRTWFGHNKPVRCLGITDDCSFLVSGGDDSVVSVWSVDDLVDVSSSSGGGGAGRGGGAAGDVVRERHSWSDHSQAVTALHVGHGGARARVFTASLDRTARVFEVFSKQLLYTVACGTFLTTIAASPDEAWLFAGGGDGAIVCVDLRAMAVAAAQGSSSSGGGASSHGAGLVLAVSHDASHARLEGHTAPVSGLLCVGMGTLLVSASDDGTVRAWDVASRQCLQTTDLKAPVACLLAAGPLDLAEPRVSGASDQDLAPLAPLRKYAQSGAPAATNLPVRLVACHHEVGKVDSGQKRVKLG